MPTLSVLMVKKGVSGRHHPHHALQRVHHLQHQPYSCVLYSAAADDKVLCVKFFMALGILLAEVLSFIKRKLQMNDFH
jgi:hypothetical protein